MHAAAKPAGAAVRQWNLAAKVENMKHQALLEPLYVRSLLGMDKVQVYQIVEHYRMRFEDRGRGNLALYADDLERYFDDQKLELWVSLSLQAARPNGSASMRAEDEAREKASPRGIERGWLCEDIDDTVDGGRHDPDA
jgi:hypothetical protein